MIIASTIKRYSNTYDSPLNIVSTHCDNKKFDSFLRKILPNGSSFTSIENSILGNAPPDIIICNNKINYLDRCGELSYFFHCPILIIDHDVKSSFIEKDVIEYQSSSIFMIAISKHISESWGNIHNLILPIDTNDYSIKEQWKNLLYQITKIPFNLKAKAYGDTDRAENLSS